MLNCSLYHSLNEGFFKHKSALQFCQLNQLTGGFVEKSTISSDNNFFAFINGPPEKSKGMIEFVAWRYLCKLEATHIENLQFLSLQTHELKSVNRAVDSILKTQQEDDPSLNGQIINLAEGDDDLTIIQNNFNSNEGLYLVDAISKLSSTIKEVTEVGIMFYFGDSKVPKDSKTATNEVVYKPYFLMHVIMGLKLLQVKGNMVLRLHQTDTLFTTELLFILYSLFESVTVYRPYTVSTLSSAQYAVCKSLKLGDLGDKIVEKLETIYAKVLAERTELKQVDIQSVIDFSLIENEDRLIQTLKSLNDANLMARSELLQFGLAAVAKIATNPKTPDLSRLHVMAIKSFDKKMELLQKWDVPILNSIAPTGGGSASQHQAPA